MKTTCTHCQQRMSHAAPRHACTVACPACGGQVRIAAHSSLPLALMLIAGVVIFGLIFSAVIGGMERRRLQDEQMSAELQAQAARWMEQAQDIKYGTRRR